MKTKVNERTRTEIKAKELEVGKAYTVIDARAKVGLEYPYDYPQVVVINVVDAGVFLLDAKSNQALPIEDFNDSFSFVEVDAELHFREI